MRNDLHGFRVTKVAAIVDFAEFARFFLTGVTATAANLCAIWLVRDVLPLESALLIGLLVGFTISFVMSKFFAFRSREFDRTPQEIARFLLVYGAGAGVYYATGLAVAHAIPETTLTPRLAELLGAFCGASLMMVTSYLGHRFFTYRRGPGAQAPVSPHVQAAHDVGGRPHRTPKT